MFVEKFYFRENMLILFYHIFAYFSRVSCCQIYFRTTGMACKKMFTVLQGINLLRGQVGSVFLLHNVIVYVTVNVSWWFQSKNVGHIQPTNAHDPFH